MFFSNLLGSFAVGWLTSYITIFPDLPLDCPKLPFLLHQHPPSQRKRIGAVTFCTSCCLNSIQIPNIWNGSLAIFLHVFLGNYERGFFSNIFYSLDKKRTPALGTLSLWGNLIKKLGKCLKSLTPSCTVCLFDGRCLKF